jgi:drug/metabolite transporter (DMT)-like permease
VTTGIPLKDWVAIVGSVMLNASAQIFLRSGLRGTQLGAVFGSRDIRAIAAIFLNPYIVGGMLCYAVSIFLWMYVLSQQPVGIVYPMMSLAYVAAVLMGVLFLGESFSTLRIVGLAFVMMGVWFIARSAA